MKNLLLMGGLLLNAAGIVLRRVWPSSPDWAGVALHLAGLVCLLAAMWMHLHGKT